MSIFLDLSLLSEGAFPELGKEIFDGYSKGNQFYILPAVYFQ